MLIVNQSDVDATWRCYDQKWVWIGGYYNTISANGGKSFYDPPDASGQYTVVFGVPGRQANFPDTVGSGRGKVPAGETVFLMGSKGAYQVMVGGAFRCRLFADPSGSESNGMGVAIAHGPGLPQSARGSTPMRA
jgi:hypothetical protein